MAALIMVSTFGCNNGLILAGARVLYAMANDNLFKILKRLKNGCEPPAAGDYRYGTGDFMRRCCHVCFAIARQFFWRDVSNHTQLLLRERPPPLRERQQGRLQPA